MNGFIVKMIDTLTSSVLWIDGQILSTREDAESYARVCEEEFALGAQILCRLGRKYKSPEEVQFVVDAV